MPAEPNRILIGCRADVTTNGVTNTERMRRLGVALYSPGYTNSQRLQILNGTLAYDQNDPEALNFQEVWLFGSVEYYVGSFSLTPAQWTRLQDRIVNMIQHVGGNTLRYCRLFDTGEPGEDFRITAANNVPALDAHVGEIMSEVEVLTLCGLTRKEGTQ